MSQLDLHRKDCVIHLHKSIDFQTVLQSCMVNGTSGQRPEFMHDKRFKDLPSKRKIFHEGLWRNIQHRESERRICEVPFWRLAQRCPRAKVLGPGQLIFADEDALQ